jgi:hypothetical protein
MNQSLAWTGKACALVVGLAIGVPSIGYGASGENLLREVREQVEIGRHSLRSDELQAAGDDIGRDPAAPGNVVACSSDAIARFRAGDKKSYLNKYDTYIYNANYTRALLPMGGDKYCVYLLRPLSRGLSIEEARDLFVAERMTFPSYTPSTAEMQAGEEELLQLRAKARAAWKTLPPARQEGILQRVDRMVECTPRELEAAGVWGPQRAAQVDFDDLGAADFMWEWAHSADGDTCLYSPAPIHRALTVDEAWDILILSQRPLPSTQFSTPVSPNGAKRKAGERIDTETEQSEQKKNQAKLVGSDSRVVPNVNSLGTPALALALVHYTGASDQKEHYATAIQVSPYVFITAAHVVVDQTSFAKNINLTVKPHYGLPDTSVSEIPVVSADYDPGFKVTDAVHQWGHDIGFLGVGVPVAGPTVTPQLINSKADTGLKTGQPGCPLGNPQFDPLYIAGATADPKSWFNGDIPTTVSSTYGCARGIRSAQTYTIGYPAVAAGQANTNHSPYIDYSGRFTGYGKMMPNQQYELYHPDANNITCSDCLAVEALKSWVTEGDSGGAVIGLANGTWTLVGIMTNEVKNNNSIGGLAAGDFDYNDPWIQSEMKWSPSGGIPPAVTITSPSDGETYNRNSIPDLVGWAGSQTGQIQWTSDIDGFLGTGGDVPIASRLTPAGHTITASLPASVAVSKPTSGSGATVVASTILATIHITVIGVTPPKIVADPMQVIVPYGSASAQTKITWTVLCDCANWRTDIAYKLNGGPWVYWKNDARAGSDFFSVKPGDTVNFYAYQHHYDYTNSMLITVTGTAGAQPQLTAPGQVVVPYGLASENVTVSWSAPGFGQVSFYGTQNLQNPGQIQCLGSAADTGAGQIGLAVGEKLTLWMLPNTSCVAGTFATVLPTAPLGTASIIASAGAAPTLTATPKTVSIPTGQSSGGFTLSWAAPGYDQVSFYAQSNLQNSGQIVCLGSGGGSGSAAESIPVGDVISFWLLPYTACTPGAFVTAVPNGVLASTTVNTSAPPPPVLSAWPNPVIIAADQTTGSYTLSWSAPGYSGISLFGQKTLGTTGPIQCLGNGPASGSAQEGIAVGEIDALWMLPNMSCTAGSSVSAVPSGVLYSINVRGHH